jgi:thioredoxin 1
VLLTALSLAGCEGAAVSEQDARPTTVQPTTVQPTDVAQAESGEDSSPVGLPLLLDLGASKCVPCKMMAPILDELSEEYAGVMQVVFIDVWEDRDAGMRYGIQSIPTQIFYDATGKELFRHEGFLGKEEILAKWKELGVELSPRSAEG